MTLPVDLAERGWRTLATAICFAAFGAGGIMIGILLYPSLRVLTPNPHIRSRLARACIRAMFRSFVLFMRALGVLTYDVRGDGRLRRRGLLIVANHPSLIDVIFLMALVREANCVVKASLASSIFTRGPIMAAGYLCNDSGPELIDECIESLRAGSNLIVFAEGTRTPRDGETRLRRGAANVAIRGGFDVTPVRITCTPPTLVKGEKWYKIPETRPHFEIEVGEDIMTSPVSRSAASPAIATRRLTEILARQLIRETHRAGT